MREWFMPRPGHPTPEQRDEKVAIPLNLDDAPDEEAVMNDALRALLAVDPKGVADEDG